MEHRLDSYLDWQDRNYRGGYRPVAPSREAERIDSAMCAEAQCENCGHVGMRYWPLSKAGSYRAFAM